MLNLLVRPQNALSYAAEISHVEDTPRSMKRKRTSYANNKSIQALSTLFFLSSTALASPSLEGPIEVEHYTSRQLNEILDLPNSYSRYMPPWVVENYDQAFAQAPAEPSWTSEAKQGLNKPGWTKYLPEYSEARFGELSPPALHYTADDIYAVSAWIEQACPSSICRNADRSAADSVDTDKASEDKKMVALARAATMASYPNTAQNLQQFGRDHFSWYYVLARAATQNGSGQLLKINADLNAAQNNLLRNGGGTWSRDPLKGQMDTLNQPVFAGMRAATNVHMRDELNARSHAINDGMGTVAALNPIFGKDFRYRSYGVRHLHAQEAADPRRAQVAPDSSKGWKIPVMTSALDQEGGKELFSTSSARETAEARRADRFARREKKKSQAAAKKGLKKGLRKFKHVGKQPGRQWKHGNEKVLKKPGIPLLARAAAAALAAGAAFAATGSSGMATDYKNIDRTAQSARESSTLYGSWNSETGNTDKGVLTHVKQTPHLNIPEIWERLSKAKGERLAPVIPPGPIVHAPPARQPPKFRTVVPATYHGQSFHPSPRPMPLVVGEHAFLHPKMAAHFDHAPMDYEHALCGQGHCPGRRRILRGLEGEDIDATLVSETHRDGQLTAMHEPAGHEASKADIENGNPSNFEGDKGILFHHDESHVTKLIPIERPDIYEGEHKPTIYKPLRRVYRQPSENTFVIWVPQKKHNHPWFQGH